ncbi:MAG: VanW family protein [Clostridia bacterium]|nr:VanW family protein [Clostridia bacterium]
MSEKKSSSAGNSNDVKKSTNENFSNENKKVNNKPKNTEKPIVKKKQNTEKKVISKIDKDLDENVVLTDNVMKKKSVKTNNQENTNTSNNSNNVKKDSKTIDNKKENTDSGKKEEKKKADRVAVKENQELKSQENNKKEKADTEILDVNYGEVDNFVGKVREKVGVFRVFVMLFILFIVIMIGLGVTFSVGQMMDKKIKKGISINGIDVSKLSKSEATNKIESKIVNGLSDVITFKYENYTYVVPLKQVQAHLDVDSAVDMAYSIGRNGNVFSNSFDVAKLWFNKTNINMGVVYDDVLLNSCFSDISAKLPNQVVQPSYYIDDDELIITSGKPGPAVDVDKAKEIIIKAIESGDYNNSEYELPIKTKEPDSIDIDKIAKEVEREPKDAYYTVEPRMVYPHENGIKLSQSIDEIKEILKEPKDEYEISLDIIRPNVTVNDIGQEAFPDLLSTFSTYYYEGNYNRTTNLILSSNKINGVVVMPGETFSYNKTVGERTVEAGYKDAAIFQDGQVVDGLGGGICQISSTLYNTVLYANLEVVERSNHAFVTSYLPGGRDATVVYGALDFKFKNNRNYPIKISSTVEGGVATISFYGLRSPDDYEVEITQSQVGSIPYSTEYISKPGYASGSVIQSGNYGSIYESYKNLYRDGELVSSTLIETDTYSPMNTLIAR